jgi:hypothetical protein
MNEMPMTITKALPFVMAVFLLLTPSLLAAQAPTSGAGKPDGAGPGHSGGRRLR